MMMMVRVCVLTLPVCFTRPHGMFLVLYRVTNHMAGAPPPSLSETGTYIHMHIYNNMYILYIIYIMILILTDITQYRSCLYVIHDVSRLV